MLLLSYGTRPEYIKLLPIIKILKEKNANFTVLYIRQHTSINVDFQYDHSIDISDTWSNRLDSIVECVMNKIAPLKSKGVTHVMVQGDTTSALAMALSAFHHNIGVIHLEAGLRTYKKHPWPEEINRRLISQIATLHLCPTAENKENLKSENNPAPAYVVGNTIIDNLKEYRDTCRYENMVLVTMHRRENHDDMDNWFRAINALATKHPHLVFLMPLHPNPNVQKHSHLLDNVVKLPPQNHTDFLRLLTRVKFVITDSGGLQEECSYFNKKCFVCRETTERPESLSVTSFLINSPKDLQPIFEEHLENFVVEGDCPFGDGHAAEKIYDILHQHKII
jgi:UDP-N-acetylglucosamine 2-epimerase (non-hydrolysing)